MRRVLVLTLATVSLLSPTGVAQADSVQFDLAVTHEATASPHAVVITVTTSDADQVGPETINVFLRSDLDDQFRPLTGRTGIQVHLDRVDARTSRAVVAIPDDGEWIVLPFADLEASGIAPLQSADAFPIVSFPIPWTGTTERIRAPHSSSSWPIAVVAIGGGAVAAAIIVLVLFRLLDRRSGSAVVVGPEETP